MSDCPSKKLTHFSLTISEMGRYYSTLGHYEAPPCFALWLRLCACNEIWIILQIHNAITWEKRVHTKAPVIFSGRETIC